MASAIFDTHAFVKRLIAAGMPEQQAEILAEEHAGPRGERSRRSKTWLIWRSSRISSRSGSAAC
jgi:hypothetical protein